MIGVARPGGRTGRGPRGRPRRVVEARWTGDLSVASPYAGESIGLVTGERSAADVVRELTVGAEQALRDTRDLLV